MIKTVSYLLAGALAVSAWTVKAEAQGNGTPTGGTFAKEHPRRDDVNTRVENQRERINQGLKNGKLTGQEAQQLRANDRAIKQQEHADVKANGGYLTPAQQKPGRERQQQVDSRRETSAVAFAAHGTSQSFVQLYRDTRQRYRLARWQSY